MILFKIKGKNMKKIVLTTMLLLVISGCETGVKNKTQANNKKEVQSGIVDRDASTKTTSHTVSKKTTKVSSNKIYSKSAQPGYYLQMAVFEKNEPSKEFLRPLDNAPFDYILLTHYNRHYVLIGPYKSYNETKAKITSVKSNLHKKTFVVQVLRP